MDWYDTAIINPLSSTLGFQRSFEYRQFASLPDSVFPPAETDFPFGVAYHQAPFASDPLILEPLVLPVIFQTFGVLRDVVVQSEVRSVQAVGNVLVDIYDTAQQAGALISQGFNYLGNLAAQGSQALVNLFDSAVLRLTLSTSPSPTPAPQLPAASPSSPRKHGPESPTNTPAMAWLTVQIPTNATGMAFDFKAAGDPVDDVLVCGIGETNLFSLQAKFIPTNTIWASRLIDLSACAGMTNELSSA